MTRRQEIQDCTYQPEKRRPERRSVRARHTFDRIYHGPLRIDMHTAQAAAGAAIYRTTHYHTVLHHVHEGVTYLWRCAPNSIGGDYLAEIVRTPEGEIRCHVYKQIEMREPWRGEPRTVANRIARFAPDPAIPAVTVEQERAHFVEPATLADESLDAIYPPELDIAALTPLVPPIATPGRPLWQEEGQ